LLDIIVITLCAVICGADNWVEIEEFGKAKEEWFRRFLKLPHGIPSHDTFGRVFSLLDPEQFSACFMNWVRSVSELAHGEVVAIDGKTLRGCHDRANGRAPLHMVSAWATENRMVLGQTRTEAHSNEITAIPELLRVLELKGCLVTIDAMGCQRNIAQQVVQGGADYLLAVKANQGELHENIKDLFACGERVGWAGVAYSHHEQVGKDHGRLERRECWVITDPEELAYVDPQRQWASLGAVARVSYRRHAATDAPTDTRYYICSYPADAATLLAASRSHWSIENSRHWVLDVAFDGDHSRVRTGHPDQNLAVVRYLASNLLK
jgi:predicted transposase YbfD/YdcC